MMTLAFHEERTANVSATLNLVRNRIRHKHTIGILLGNCFSDFGIYLLEVKLNPSLSSIFPLI